MLIASIHSKFRTSSFKSLLLIAHKPKATGNYRTSSFILPTNKSTLDTSSPTYTSILHTDLARVTSDTEITTYEARSKKDRTL